MLGALTLAGSTSGAVTIQPQPVAGTWTFTLPQDAGGGNGYFLQTNGSGLTQWAPASGSTLTLGVGTTNISGGATTRILYDNAGVLGEYTISGTGTVVAMATSPSFTTPALGTPTAGVLSSCTGYAQSALTGLGTGVSTALGVNVGSAGAFVVNGGALGTPASGTLTNCTGLVSFIVANEATDATCNVLFTTEQHVADLQFGNRGVDRFFVCWLHHRQRGDAHRCQ